MSDSATRTGEFTITDARYIASKIKTDLAQMRQFYGAPSETQIERFGTEAEILLVKGYLRVIKFGFRRGGKFIPPTLQYTAQSLTGDDNPGRVPADEDISGATFYSFLELSPAWHALSETEQARFEASLPFIRTTAEEPSVSSGIWVNGKSYSSNGGGVARSVLRSS